MMGVPEEERKKRVGKIFKELMIETPQIYLKKQTRTKKNHSCIPGSSVNSKKLFGDDKIETQDDEWLPSQANIKSRSPEGGQNLGLEPLITCITTPMAYSPPKFS